MARVIQHSLGVNPFTGAAAGDGAVEYRLLVEDDDLSPDGELPRQYAPVAKITPEEAQSWLAQSYSRSISRSVSKFCHRMAKSRPTSIVQFDARWYVRCCFDGPDNYNAGNEFYLAPRQNFDVIRELLDEFDPHSRSFVEFLRLCAGYRESMPPMSGHFLYDEFVLFADNPWSENLDDPDDYEEWLDALCLYYARNGDLLLLSEGGETGWFFHEEGRVEMFTENFDEFVRRLTEFNEKYEEPFDAYSSYSPSRLRQ